MKTSPAELHSTSEREALGKGEVGKKIVKEVTAAYAQVAEEHKAGNPTKINPMGQVLH